MSVGYLTSQDWLRGWREWARTRKRGRMAQFIVDKLEEGKQARWLDISKGLFELTEWHVIAKEWFEEKPRNSEQVDAPCMLRKGLPRAFPGLDELKDQSRKEGTQYRSRVFQAPIALVQEVLLHITNRAAIPHQMYSSPPPPPPPTHDANNMGYHAGYANGGAQMPSGTAVQAMPQYYHRPTVYTTPPVKMENTISMDYEATLATNGYSDSNGSGYLDAAAQIIAGGDPNYTSVSSASTGWYSPNTVAGPTNRLRVSSSPSGSAVFNDDVGMLNSPAFSISPSNSPIYSQPDSVPDITYSQPIPGEVSPVPQAPSGSPAMLPAVEETEPNQKKLLSVKAVPNQSTLEGGGTVALVFYQQLPVGGKFICFMSRSNPNNAVTKQAYEENALVLTTDIPKHTVAEVVDLFVYGSNGQLLASTLFTYYDAMQSHSSDMILQILQQQLHNYFPTQGAMGASAVGGQTGSGAGYSSGYSVPNTAYQLLLGACRLGCEPLVNIILALPLMAAITSDELQKACEIAQNCGHTNLYEVLQQMVIMAGIPQAQMISRDPTGSGNEEKKGHVEEYYTAMNKLSNGGITPEERASTVMKHLLAAIKESAQSVPTVAVVPSEEEEEPSKSAGAVEELTTQLEATSITPKTRRHSHLQHQQSISDEDDPSADVPHSDHSRVSLSEQSDTVAPLPRDDIHTKRKQTFAQAQAQSETDSAIGMSFEDESMLGEVQFRKNSGFTTIDFARDSSVKTITVKLPPDAGTEVANSLAWKTTFVVTEDFPPSSERKIFHRGDHILQIGSKLVTGMSREEFAELFDKEASAGTSMTVLPNLHSDSKEHKMLRRTPSDQTILDTIGKRVNQLFTMRSSSNVRHVSIPHMSTGFGVKMIGGKSVGVFISDVMSDVKTVATGDQVLAINGHTTQGLTLHKATKLLRLSSSDLKLSVVENKARFQSVRERFELDSFYMRSRIDMPSTSVKDMSVKKGMLLHVVNTFMHAPNHWLAWAVDEDTAMETQLRRIPSPAMAKKTYKTDAYDSVERQSEAVHRPVCIVGPDSKHVAEGLATRPQFKLCSTLVETLTVFAQGTHQPVFSSTDGTELEQMKNLNPILLQTRATVTAPLANQIACSKLNVSGYLFGENPSDLVNHAAQQVEDHLYRPTWRTVEACC